MATVTTQYGNIIDRLSSMSADLNALKRSRPSGGRQLWRLSLRVWWAICWPRSWGDYMPSNLLSADTGFPDLMGNQSTDEKFRMVSDYLYMLLEQLRYSMANLGRENFNDTAFQEIAGLITEPVYIQLKDVEGNLSSLTVTAEQLISRMTDAEGNISVLQQTSTSLTSQVSDLEGTSPHCSSRPRRWRCG